MLQAAFFEDRVKPFTGRDSTEPLVAQQQFVFKLSSFDQVFSHLLKRAQLQASFLEDMVTSCDEEESAEATWAADEEVTTTEELEARLRSHRLDNTAVRFQPPSQPCMLCAHLHTASPYVNAHLRSHRLDNTAVGLCCQY